MRERPDGAVSPQSAPGREAEPSASRPTPLTVIAGAVAGDDLRSVAATVASALRRPVAIAIPALGAPVIAPAASLSHPEAAAIVAHAGAVIAGAQAAAPDAIAEAVPVQIADQVVGIVAAPGLAPEGNGSSAEQRAWLEAAAAAASVIALIRADAGGADDAQALITELATGIPHDVPGFVARARRLGHELSAGGVALCACPVAGGPVPLPLLTASNGGPSPLLASRPCGRILVLVALTDADVLRSRLVEAGFSVSRSAPRRDPALLHEAMVEAELLAELDGGNAQEDTYRLLIGVLLRDREALEQLRASTVTPLAEYDARHDTDLLATLRAFLIHDGSTTETAEAMSLHRHTVGYRLTRVHEVSGLSPYESEGRERLSLGIKADQILEAAARRR